FGMSAKTLEGGLLTAKYADVAMVTYNLHHLDELPVIAACRQQGKGVLIKKAFASGRFTVPKQSDGQENDREQDPVQASLNLVLNQPGVSSAIVGTINPQHLRDNV